MSTTFDLVTIDSPHPAVLAVFWVEALGLVETEREDGDRWVVLSEPSGQRRVGIQRGPTRVGGGVHLDLRCPVDEFASEVARLLALGATAVGTPRQEPYGYLANLLDPDGNPVDLCAYNE